MSKMKLDMKNVAFVLLGLMAIVGIEWFLKLPLMYGVGVETIWIAFCANRFWKLDGRMSFCVGFFYEICVHLWQYLAVVWFGVLLKRKLFVQDYFMEGQVTLLVLHVFFIGIVAYILQSEQMDDNKIFRVLSGICMLGFFGALSLKEQTVVELDPDTVDMWIYFSIALMVALLVINMRRQYEMERELADLKLQQAELLERDYANLNQAYSMNAKLFHDFHNHIGVLRQLLNHEKMKEAMEYLDALQAPVREMTQTIWTGDETVDYLINSKEATAKEHHIAYQAHVEFPKNTNLRAADLCAILGNLLDNAIEAAKQVENVEQRFIKLTIRRINQMLVIKVENGYRAAPVKVDGALQTTKKDGGLHGWGVKSAQTAAEKYDGMVQTKCEGQVFQAVVTLSFACLKG
ncbi:MAG: GHKL domain-containing protein [Eubacteriales bacterium]|nr:GHKL domain-containing protein [Eubacteriales bacterium]